MDGSNTMDEAAAAADACASSDDDAAEAADLASDRSTDLAATGRYDEALTEARRAVDGYRALAGSDPDIYLPDLAAALDNFASRAGEVGARADAADAAQESVDLFRALAAPALEHARSGAHAASAAVAGDDDRDPAADESALFLPYLAAAMSNLSVRQHENGDDPVALETAHEAAALFRSLTAAPGDEAAHPIAGGLLPEEPDHAAAPPLGEHSAGLAMALSNLANRLDEAHRRTESLAVSGEAAAIYQQLIVVDTDRFRPLLAQTINNRAVLLRESGGTAVAISTTRQAVNLYRSLAATQPEKYRDYLAMALGNLANMLTDAGRGRDALGVAQEATTLYRQLAADAVTPSSEENPYDAPLAMSLNNLAIHLAEANRREEALTATQEASALYRTLARRNPQAHLGNLAGTLTNLGSNLATAGRTADALTATREAVDVTRRLAFGNRPAYLPQLAQAVNNLAIRLHEAGRDASALASARECARLYEELTQKDPDQFAEASQRIRELLEFLASRPA